MKLRRILRAKSAFQGADFTWCRSPFEWAALPGSHSLSLTGVMVCELSAIAPDNSDSRL